MRLSLNKIFFDVYKTQPFSSLYIIILFSFLTFNSSIILSSEQVDEYDTTCQICMDHELEVELRCNHKLCHDCFKKIKSKEGSSCPFCRAPITNNYHPKFLKRCEHIAASATTTRKIHSHISKSNASYFQNTSKFSEQEVENYYSKIRHRHFDEVVKLASIYGHETRDKHGNTPLHIACQNGSKRIAKIFLRQGADINSQNKRGQTPLHFAINYNFCKLSSYLVSKGANDQIRNSYALTCYEGLRVRNSY